MGGTVSAHLGQACSICGSERPSRGACQASVAASSAWGLAGAWSIERCHRPGLLSFQCLLCVVVVARMVEGRRDHGRQGDVVLITVVGLLEASADFDHPLGAGHLQLEIGLVGTTMNFMKHGCLSKAWYVPGKSTTSKVSSSLWKLSGSPNVMCRRPRPKGMASMAGMTP